ncbi:hypothetical protein [Croceibacter atlanticus]|uniref:hypothetical protein n=2 Tax=Flavobacteriaceae TaxID=49546 RepID=UPI0030F5A450
MPPMRALLDLVVHMLSRRRRGIFFNNLKSFTNANTNYHHRRPKRIQTRTKLNDKLDSNPEFGELNDEPSELSLLRETLIKPHRRSKI